MEKISDENLNLNNTKDIVSNNKTDEDLDDFAYKDVELYQESISNEINLNKIDDNEFINDENNIDNDELNVDKKKVYDYVRNFEWSKEMEENAKKIVDENSEVIVDRFIDMQARNWDKFYKHNTTNFFKDRHYILAEFPELKDDNRVSYF